MTRVAIVDSGGANIASLLFAFERLGVAAELTTDGDVIGAAERVVLPLSLIHISEPTRLVHSSRMPSSA